MNISNGDDGFKGSLIVAHARSTVDFGNLLMKLNLELGISSASKRLPGMRNIKVESVLRESETCDYYRC